MSFKSPRYQDQRTPFHSTNLFFLFHAIMFPLTAWLQRCVRKPRNRSDEGLALKTSQFECFYGGQLRQSTL